VPKPTTAIFSFDEGIDLFLIASCSIGLAEAKDSKPKAESEWRQALLFMTLS
jgi:hypothetical protein